MIYMFSASKEIVSCESHQLCTNY